MDIIKKPDGDIETRKKHTNILEKRTGDSVERKNGLHRPHRVSFEPHSRKEGPNVTYRLRHSLEMKRNKHAD
jgi:hypothetical protein